MTISVFDKPEAPLPIRVAAWAPVVLFAGAAAVWVGASIVTDCRSEPDCDGFGVMFPFLTALLLVAAGLAWAIGAALRQGALWAWYLSLVCNGMSAIAGGANLANPDYGDIPLFYVLMVPLVASSLVVVLALLHPASLRWRTVLVKRSVERRRPPGPPAQ